MRRWLLGGVAAVVLLVAGANAFVLLGGRGGAPEHAEAALVLGALVDDDGRPSAMLEDRITTAARLYRDGRVDKVLVSGDHGTRGYDEVTPMRKRLIELGVPAADVFEDHAGFDTWDSVVRARKVFGLRDAIVVTQGFHLPRAVWLARRAGLTAGGVPADSDAGYGREGTIADVREVLARVKGFGSGLFKPRPKVLGPHISLSGDGRVTRGPTS